MADSQPFCFPVTVLQNKRLKLVPFCSKRHAPKFFELTRNHPELYAHTANGPYNSTQHFVETFLEKYTYYSEYALTYAIIDKTKPPSAEDDEGGLVGLISYEEADDETFAIEIGHVRTIPAYQRQGIATTAASLLLQHALNSLEEGGLALSRVEWHSSTQNVASIKVAEKLGFSTIGTVNYERILPQGVALGKIGNGRENAPRGKPGDLWRDLAMFSVTWDEWRDGVKERVAKLLE